MLCLHAVLRPQAVCEATLSSLNQMPLPTVLTENVSFLGGTAGHQDSSPLLPRCKFVTSQFSLFPPWNVSF